jgi:phage-related holin
MELSNIQTNLQTNAATLPRLPLERRQWDLSQHISKLVAAIGAAIIAAVGSPVPDNLKKMTWLVLVLVIADTFAGVYAAIWTKTLESHKLVEKLAHKGVLYSILMLIAFVPCAIFTNWASAYAMAFLMMLRELISLIETAKKLMMNGKDFGRISAFLDRIGNVLAVSAEQAATIVSVQSDGKAATVVVASAPPAPAVVGEDKEERAE